MCISCCRPWLPDNGHEMTHNILVYQDAVNSGLIRYKDLGEYMTLSL